MPVYEAVIVMLSEKLVSSVFFSILAFKPPEKPIFEYEACKDADI